MEERLYYLLNTAQHEIRKFVDEEGLRRVGLTSAHMGLLFFVAKRDGCLLSEAGRGLGLSNATVTGLITRVERTGVIKRQPSNEDKRATQLFLTAKGRRQLEEIKKLNEDLNGALREGFEAEEIRIVMRWLGHVKRLAEQKKEE